MRKKIIAAIIAALALAGIAGATAATTGGGVTASAPQSWYHG